MLFEGDIFPVVYLLYREGGREEKTGLVKYYVVYRATQLPVYYTMSFCNKNLETFFLQILYQEKYKTL